MWSYFWLRMSRRLPVGGPLVGESSKMCDIALSGALKEKKKGKNRNGVSSCSLRYKKSHSCTACQSTCLVSTNFRKCVAVDRLVWELLWWALSQPEWKLILMPGLTLRSSLWELLILLYDDLRTEEEYHSFPITRVQPWKWRRTSWHELNAASAVKKDFNPACPFKSFCNVSFIAKFICLFNFFLLFSKACMIQVLRMCVWECWLSSARVSDYTSYEVRLLHMYLALYSSSMAFEFRLKEK